MIDIAAKIDKTAKELGYINPEEYAAFTAGARLGIGLTLHATKSIIPSEPTDEEIQAGADALMTYEIDTSWMEASPHQRYEYSERARVVIQAVTSLHTKEDVE